MEEEEKLPVPQPRKGQNKRPVPLPRKSGGGEGGGSLRRKLVDGGSQVIESLERSVKEILTRKEGSSSAPPSVAAPPSPPPSSSSPFHSIHFGSPIGPPPYPPPPLPDESLYDEPTSSSSTRCDSFYEEIARFKELSMDSLSMSSDRSECKEESVSESWTYRGGTSPYVNVELGGKAALDNIYSKSATPRAGVYENVTLSPVQSVTSKSVILEFDPLYRDEEYSLIAPPPPLRFDSLDSDTEPTPAPRQEAEGEEVEGDVVEDGKREGERKRGLGRWSSMKRAMKMVKGRRGCGKVEEHRIEAKTQLHSGEVARGDDLSPRWASLENSSLVLSLEKGGVAKETIPLGDILSIHDVGERAGGDYHCWEVSVVGRSRGLLLGSTSSLCARLWTQKTLESLTSAFPPLLTSSYSRAGWAYIKESITGEWRHGWILLEKRTLYYVTDKASMKELDLRKARSIVLKEGKEEGEREWYVVLVFGSSDVLYMRCEGYEESKAWRRDIRSAALRNGTALQDQQMTKDDVPLIVDKCINFIYAHGSCSEGIYRRSGSSSRVSALLTKLRSDGWSCLLTKDEYSEYDVATALKRFFRDLPQPLLTYQLYKYFCNAASIECNRDEKVEMYRRGLEQLPPVNYVTAKRLIGHLHFIHLQSEKNLMPVENLAALWGPTLIQSEGMGGVKWSKKECDVVGDLILEYSAVFGVETEEQQREERIRQVLEKVQSGDLLPARPSGDLRIWIHIGSKESNQSANITIGGQTLCGDVCGELWRKTGWEEHEVCLTEVVLGGALSRPLHHSERLLDVVLRWSYWDSNDSTHNYLALTPNTTLRELVPFVTHSHSAKSSLLRYADDRSKSFKSYWFDFSHAKLSYYKDKACLYKAAEWNVEDIVWYIGHEPKRNPHTRWAVTFIEKERKGKRSKEVPYFGHTIGGTKKEEQLEWMAALLLARYSALLPSPHAQTLIPQ